MLCVIYIHIYIYPHGRTGSRYLTCPLRLGDLAEAAEYFNTRQHGHLKHFDFLSSKRERERERAAHPMSFHNKECESARQIHGGSLLLVPTIYVHFVVQFQTREPSELRTPFSKSRHFP